MPRRLPPPWTIEELPEYFLVRDANGNALAHIYFEDEDSRRTILDRLRRNRARRIAANITKLPAFIEAVEATDHDEATKTAVEQFDKPMRDRFRVSVRVVVRGRQLVSWYAVGKMSRRILRRSPHMTIRERRFLTWRPWTVPRRFPAPWFVDELEECFVIKDASGQPLAYVYFEPHPNNESRRAVMNRLTREEARRIAMNIGKLPALLGAH
jgi:hypothetical protein